jgi:hypothetical protein
MTLTLIFTNKHILGFLVLCSFLLRPTINCFLFSSLSSSTLNLFPPVFPSIYLLVLIYSCLVFYTFSSFSLFFPFSNLMLFSLSYCFAFLFYCFFLNDFIFLYFFPPCGAGITQNSDGLRTGQPGFDAWQGQEIFPYCTAFRPALGPTKSPIQWVPWTPSSGIKRLRCEADHPSPSSA